ncbi:hypothetical protein A2961_01315 [Candidatus Woesebacteria bacterium RIFCSPLOWO2_01_FULL_39_21]|uniref:Glycosyltransferase subfamily 4-like N-terminal domain-containing protein n=1 Tax=Candidatus Woesebacteria bacterium RIFCSPLOWO2_01_FULL_39_21 TaxID=1802519 RepID=A0A1F8BGG3_9BACT|nr:MAG: hypothetical protein A2691_03730 [Candidatus Woesebacteria bacterium RIFCSPHIGHO2_01_FULL_39_23]OGM63161.1 MAG: hypothetical protein A2961_01315 [Candidatus Woesebacteria bacterium RIFCSPLOWO2_01_FULL_39_21]
MNVVILVSYTYPFIGSGLGQVALMQAEGLTKLGHQVVLVSSNIPATWKRFKRNRVLHLKQNCLNFMDKFSIPVPFFFLSREVISHIENADVVHSHDMLYPHSMLAALVAKRFAKPFVLTQHAGFISYPNRLTNLLQLLTNKTMGKLVLKLSDQIIVVNEDVKNWLGKDGTSAVTLMNGVNTSLFHPVTQKTKMEIRKKYGFPLNKKIVLYVGRLVKKKGFQRLFEVKSSDYLIIIVGLGEVPEYMTNEKDKVLFLGAISQKKLSEIYQASDVFVLPSDCEGFPLSIQEAMASGLPIITSKHPGFDKYLDRHFVKFISPTSIETKRAIVEIFKNKKLRDTMVHYSLKTTIAKASWENNVQELLKIYQKVI